MVDSQIFMYDAVCAYGELDEFLTRLKKYDEAYRYAMKLIAEKRDNCYLILKLYRYIMKHPSKGPIIVVGEREMFSDLIRYPRLLYKVESDEALDLPPVPKKEAIEVEFNPASHGKLIRAIRYMVPYGLVISRRMRQTVRKVQTENDGEQ